MASDSPSTHNLTPEASLTVDQRAAVTAIDVSARGPVIGFFGFSLVWLVIGSVLSLITAWKLISPGFLGDVSWLTYGRVQPAQSNAFLFGWCANGAFAVTLWIMSRLSGATVRGAGVVFVAGIFWNLGVALGIGGILSGDSTGLTWLEFPRYATPLLLIAYALFGAWVFATFRTGKTSPIYVSQWYLFAALFWFPWIYTVAQVLLVFAPVRGTLQSLVNAWFVHNVFGLWLTPVALAVIYYFLPKLLGRTIRNYYLAGLAFWWLAVFSSLTGAASLIGSPIPVWAQGAGTGASFMLLVPLVIIGLNFFGTLCGSAAAVKSDTTLRFLVVAIFAFVLTLSFQVLFSLRGIAEFTQFTFLQTSLNQLGLYGFVSMAIFGAGYYILPRVLGRPFPPSVLIPLHFWSSVLGLGLVLVGWVLAGFQQVSGIADTEKLFVSIGADMRPFLFTASLGALLLTIGHVAFALNFARGVFAFAATSIEPARSPSALRPASR